MSRRLVLSNALILQGEELEPVRGYLAVRDGLVERISEGSPPGLSRDVKGAVIMPPFFNAHTHVGDSAWKEIYCGRNQRETVGPGGVKHRLLETAKDMEIVRGIRASVRSMIRGGVLGFCDFREGGLEGVKILRGAVGGRMMSFALGRGETLSECMEVMREADGIGAPSLDFLRFEEIQKLAREARRTGKMFAVHVSETEEAERRSLELRGEGELSAAVGLRPSFVVHATHSGEEDLRKAARRRLPLVFCPRANRLLSVGSPPIARAIEIGAEFWLGSDNVSVCEPDMFEVLRSAWECVRVSDPRAGEEEARILLRAATVGPLGFFTGRGRLEEGGEATFLVLARRENLSNVRGIFAGIVNRASARNVAGFFLRGERILPGRKTLLAGSDRYSSGDSAGGRRR